MLAYEHGTVGIRTYSTTQPPRPQTTEQPLQCEVQLKSVLAQADEPLQREVQDAQTNVKPSSSVHECEGSELQTDKIHHSR